MMKKNLLLAGLISASNLKSQNKSFGGALHGGLLIPINNDSIEFLIRAETASFNKIEDIGLYFSAGARYYDDDLSALALLSFPTIARGLKAESKEYLKKIRLTLNGLIELSANIPGLHVGIQGSLAYSGFGIGAALFYKMGRYEIGIDGYYSQKLNESKNKANGQAADGYRSLSMHKASANWIEKLRRDFYEKQYEEIIKTYPDPQRQKQAKKDYRKRYDPFFDQVSGIYLKVLYTIYKSDKLELLGLYQEITNDFEKQIKQCDSDKYKDVFNSNKNEGYRKQLLFRFALKAYNDFIKGTEKDLNTLLSAQNLEGVDDTLQARVIANTVECRVLEKEALETLRQENFLSQIHSEILCDSFFQNNYPKARQAWLLEQITLQRKKQLVLDEYLINLDSDCNQEQEVHNFIESNKALFQSNDDQDYAKRYFAYYLSNERLMGSKEAKWSMQWIIKNESTDYKEAKKDFSENGFAKEEIFDFVARKFEKDVYIMINHLISYGNEINQCNFKDLQFNLKTTDINDYEPIFKQLKEYIKTMYSNMKNEFMRVFWLHNAFTEDILKTSDENSLLGVCENKWSQSYVFYCLKKKLGFEKEQIISACGKNATEKECSNLAEEVLNTIKNFNKNELQEQGSSFFSKQEIEKLLRMKFINDIQRNNSKEFEQILNLLKGQYEESNPVELIRERFHLISSLEIQKNNLEQQLERAKQDHASLEGKNETENNDLKRQINELREQNNELVARLAKLQTEKETQEHIYMENAQQSQLELNSANGQLEEEKKKNKELQDNYDSLNKKFKESSQNIEHLQKENSRLNGENQGLKLRSSYSETIKTTSINSQENLNNDHALKNELEKLKEKNARLKKSLEEALEQEQKKSQALTVQIEQLTIQITEQINRIKAFDESTQNITQLQKEIESISKERDDAQAKAEKLNEELGINQTKSNKLEEEKNKLTDFLNRIKQSLVEHKLDQNCVAITNATIAIINEWKGHAVEYLKAEQSQNEDLEQELAKKNKEIETLTAEINALKTEQQNQLTQNFEFQKSNLETEKAALEEEKNRLQAALNESSKQLKEAQEEAQEKIDRLEKEKKALEEQLEIARVNSSSNNTNISIQIQNLTTQLTEEKSKLALQNQSVQDLTKQLEDTRAQLDKAELAKQQLQAELNRLTQQINAEKEKTQNSVDDLKDKNRARQETIDDLKNKLLRAQAEINRKNNEIRSLTHIVNSKNDEERIKTLTLNLKQLNLKLDTLQTQFDDAMKRLNTQTFEITNLKTKIREKETLIQEKETLIQEKETIIKTYTNQNHDAANQQRIKQLKKERDELTNQLQQLKSKKDSLEDKFNSYKQNNPEHLKDELERANKKISELTGAKKSPEEVRKTIFDLKQNIKHSTIQTKCDQCEKLQKLKNNLKEENDRLKEKNDRLKKENDRLKREKKTLTDKIQELQDKITQLKKEKADQTAQLEEIEKYKNKAKDNKPAIPPTPTPPTPTPTKQPTRPTAQPARPTKQPARPTAQRARSTTTTPAISQSAMICQYQEKIQKIFEEHFSNEKFPFMQQNLVLENPKIPLILSKKDQYTKTVVQFWKNVFNELLICYNDAMKTDEYTKATIEDQGKIINALDTQIASCADQHYKETLKYHHEQQLYFENHTKQGGGDGKNETIKAHIEKLVRDLAKDSKLFIQQQIKAKLQKSMHNIKSIIFVRFFNEYWKYYNTTDNQITVTIQKRP